MIITSWVNVEINDSTIRPAYLQDLRDNGINVYIIDETEYIDVKGGAGKTTTVINLARQFAEQEHKVLLTDNDLQPYKDLYYKLIKRIK